MDGREQTAEYHRALKNFNDNFFQEYDLNYVEIIGVLELEKLSFVRMMNDIADARRKEHDDE